MQTLIISLVIIAVVVFTLVSIYNGLVTLRNRYKNAFSQIDVQLKRRYDLIPNLVETAKAYMKHEKDTLEAVISARNRAVEVNRGTNANLNAEGIKQLGGAEAALSQSLGKLFALSENYPDLKANQNMMQLSEELSSTENKISFARQAFNDSVTVYNTAIEKFPNNMLASFFRFSAAALLEIQNEQEREAVRVSF